ncbi:MAG: polysaccharide biosynthesis protein [Lentisphaerae bacterium]|nr:polysaccharide biosynthesis protein [Lentisphaerota bacterium]
MTDSSFHSTLIDWLRRHAWLRRLLIIAWHVAGTCVCYCLAFYIRFEGDLPAAAAGMMRRTLPILVLVNLSVFALVRLHSGMWAFFSMSDLARVLFAVVSATGIFALLIFVLLDFSFREYPRSVFVITLLLMVAWMAGARLVVRLIRERKGLSSRRESGRDRALIVGRLEDAEDVIKAWDEGNTGIRAVVTDETSAIGLTERGVPVTGPVSEIGRIARRLGADRVIILPPYTKPRQINQIMEDCSKAGAVCTFKMIPSMADVASGRVQHSGIRSVELEDLLGRPELSFNRQSVRDMISGKIVMVTGAGGSIGSELVRQIAHYGPKKLIMLDMSEFNLYSIDMELRKSAPGLALASMAGSVCDAGLLDRLFRRHPVQVLFHAAAYKHVPIMEDNVAVCVHNNVVGTARLADKAQECGVERFVLISSDKAVRPTSVMGATKRLAEEIVQNRRNNGPPCFVTVRFGNVLGSSGSVIPLFKEQIRRGGPVTVTSPNMTRFFMSIPEAVDLVLQAGVGGNNGDIMVLEMGETVRIADMARRLIELSGLRAGEDIEIAYTGIRPGEKEFEELMTEDENVVRTPYEKIWVIQKKPGEGVPPLDIESLSRLAETGDEFALRAELARLIPDATLGKGGRGA